MDKQYDLTDALSYINPAMLDYNEWLAVGMALKESDYPCDVWDEWSRQDHKRYKKNECEKKWAGFNGVANPVTAGSLIVMAKSGGWRPTIDYGHPLDWDDYISDDGDGTHIKNREWRKRIKDPGWIPRIEITEPPEWDPAAQLITYLETLFEAGENVGYVTECWEKTVENDTKYLPTRGCWDRTAGELIEKLNKCGGDIGSVIGDYNPDAGAWIRFNPMDGKGCKNENVTEFRYALVESDDQDIELQCGRIIELQLPVAIMVHSGGKSLHAIVRIDAASESEYRERVDYLYSVCAQSGLEIDKKNKNPSRLSRMPGIMRNGGKQFIAGINFGKKNFIEWQTWYEEINDNLPNVESLEEIFYSMPDLAPELISGLLRQNHKMLLAGPSKASKSFALIQLVIAIAEGRTWLKWPCAKGKVLYVNLELDKASCLHRFKDVYEALKQKSENLANIDIWNLRGKAIPMDKLAPKLIRRAKKKEYLAIVIDPIYKVITGDENSADHMAKFCNQFDILCHELKSAVIYCHHHSKGQQSQKRSIDRASGSGVLARDPDTYLDIIELELNENVIMKLQDQSVCNAITNYLNETVIYNWQNVWQNLMKDEELSDRSILLKTAAELLNEEQMSNLEGIIANTEIQAKNITAWRIEGTLREFPKFKAFNLWFDHPIHHIDSTGILDDIKAREEKAPWEKAVEKRKANALSTREKVIEETRNAIEALSSLGSAPKLKDIAEYLSDFDNPITVDTIRKRLKSYFENEYMIDKNKANVVIKISKKNN